MLLLGLLLDCADALLFVDGPDFDSAVAGAGDELGEIVHRNKIPDDPRVPDQRFRWQLFPILPDLDLLTRPASGQPLLVDFEDLENVVLWVLERFDHEDLPISVVFHVF